MKNKKTIILGLIILLIAIVFIIRFKSGGEDVWLCQNGEWVARGKPSSSKPQTACGAEQSKPKISEEKTVDQQPATENTQQSAVGDNIKITSPTSGSVISSPVKITGEAKGWYFEATFPVRLVDENGRTLAKGSAKATSDWMVDAYVPFELQLTFNPQGAKSGKLIFEKDNPSGLSENAKGFSLPVLF